MLATVSTQVWDVQGYVELDVMNTQTDGATVRRINRVATLDGSAVVNDAGFSEADRTIQLTWMNDSKTVDAAIERLVKFYGRLNVSTRTGVYDAAVESYTPSPTAPALRLLVISKISN